MLQADDSISGERPLQILIFRGRLSLQACLKIGNRKGKRKFHRIFFATGKMLVPVVRNPSRKYHFNFQVQDFPQVETDELEILEAGI